MSSDTIQTMEFAPDVWTQAQQQAELLSIGTDAVLPHGALVRRLAESIRDRRPLIIKAGFDPTAPHLHLGHTVLLMKLRQFQKLGHRVQFLIGDFTARIGDPTGRSETRKPLSDADIEANAATYKAQVHRVLDPARTETVYNSHWLGTLGPADWMRLAARATVAQMLERDDFAKRYRGGVPIGVHELFYPILQGYDSVVMRADVELGGTDQRFNLLFGRELQRADGQPEQVVMMLPILEGLDGVQKMSKSLGNAVGIDEPPPDMFGKLMSITDELMRRYIVLLADDPGYYEGLLARGTHPMDVKKQFAREVVARFHGDEAAQAARVRFETVHQSREVPDDMPEVQLTAAAVFLPALLVDLKLAASRRVARESLAAGAVSLDGVRVSESTADVQITQDTVLKYGKKEFRRLRAYRAS